MKVTTLASRIILLGIIVVLASLAIEAGLHLYNSDRNEGHKAHDGRRVPVFFQLDLPDSLQ